MFLDGVRAVLTMPWPARAWLKTALNPRMLYERVWGMGFNFVKLWYGQDVLKISVSQRLLQDAQDRESWDTPKLIRFLKQHNQKTKKAMERCRIC